MLGIDSALVDLIGSIYDSVLEPDRWVETLERIHLHLHFANAILAIHSTSLTTLDLAITVNVPEPYLGMMLGGEYAPHVLRMWGGREAMERFPVEEPIVLSRIAESRQWLDNPYYRDFAVPQGLCDSTVMFLTREHSKVGNIAFGQHIEHAPTSDETLAALRLLAPHLRRAAIVAGLLTESRARNASLESIFEGARSGIVFADGQGRLVEANPVARRMLEQGDPLRIVRGRLEIPGEVVKDHLETALAAAADGDVPLGRRGIAVPGKHRDGRPFLAHVMPLAARQIQNGIPMRAVAAVLVADTDDDLRGTIEAASLIYGLTPAEARVFELTIAGRTSDEIGRELSITTSTLKSHTQHLFEKTGLHRRSDLIRLASRLRLPG